MDIKITIPINGNEVELSIEEARLLLSQLKKIFENTDTPTWPTWPTWPKEEEVPWVVPSYPSPYDQTPWWEQAPVVYCCGEKHMGSNLYNKFD